MPTQRMAFAAPYQAETPIGQALLNISKAFFGGPGPAQQEAARRAAEESMMDSELKRRKLEGQNALGANMDRAGDFARYAPGNARDPNDPNWDVKATAAKNFYNNVPAYLAGDALRSGIDVGQAAQGRVLAYSSPLIGESMRRDAAVGANKELGPTSAFTTQGINEARNYEVRKATSAAAAGNPEGVLRARILSEEIKGQPVGSPDRLVAARLRPVPDAGAMKDYRFEKDTGLSPTERTQYEALNTNLNTFMRQSPSPDSAMQAFERAHPGGLDALKKYTTRIMEYQSRPPVNGVQMIGNKPYVPSERPNGGLVPAFRGDDGRWYKQEYGEKPQPLMSRDY
jgi:hypothetical protein